MNQLWLISMPIGNNLDFTEHARLKIQELTQIWCEDTRSFRSFCEHNQIDLSGKKIVSFHDHSDEHRIDQFLKSVKTTSIGYVSEAGSPYISDPAHNIVKACYQHDIQVKSTPGASSVIMALELSGLPAIPFSFHGFLPRNESGKKQVFEACESSGGTHIFFEGVSRVVKTINSMVEFFSDDIQFAVIREMSKKHESVYRFTKSTWSEISHDIVEKGEFVIVLYLKEASRKSSANVSSILEKIQSKGAKPKLVSKLISELTGEEASEVYKKYFKD